MGFDENEPTSRSGGKAKAVQQIRKVHQIFLLSKLHISLVVYNTLESLTNEAWFFSGSSLQDYGHDRGWCY